MLIEIKGVQFVNKGAELMLMAALQEIRHQYPDADCVLSPTNSHSPYKSIAKLGCYQKLYIYRLGINWLNAARIIPSKIRRRYGLILENEIDVVLDASGLAYSDKWGISMTAETANRVEKWHNSGKKVIFLPQAFGPFSSEEIRKSIKKIINNADLIFARDSESFNYLQDIQASSTIKLAPDFTNLVNGITDRRHEALSNRVCLITNYRMIDKLSKQEASNYIPLMARILKILHENQTNPYFLIHEGLADEELVCEIIARANCNAEIIKEQNPLVVKGIIGSSRGIVCSRFHGLVSALSQGVPALGTSWSHKYKMLFNDYDFSSGLLDTNENDEGLRRKLNYIINDNENLNLREHLNKKSAHQKDLTRGMWEEVFNEINSKK